jgi:hypothetical protein
MLPVHILIKVFKKNWEIRRSTQIIGYLISLMTRNEQFSLLNEKNGLNEWIEKNFRKSDLVWITTSSEMDDILEPCTDDLIRMLGSTGETHVKEVPIKRDGRRWKFLEMFQCEDPASNAQCFRDLKWISKTCMSNWSTSSNQINVSPCHGFSRKLKLSSNRPGNWEEFRLRIHELQPFSGMRWRYFRISPTRTIMIWECVNYLALYPYI